MDTVSLTSSCGFPSPLGVTQHALKFNFSVFAPQAKHIFVHFFLPDTEEFVGHVELKNRTGKVFHGLIDGVDPSWLYALQAIQKKPRDGDFINDKLLIDPYAKALNKPMVWSPVQYKDNNPFLLPKAKLTTPDFDWKSVVKPNIPKHETVIYELHVKGFTKLNELVPESIRGTYAALAEPCVIDYLKSLGVTSLQLLPVFSFMSEPRLEELGLTNYWGYNPINFFAPDVRYAKHDAVSELKTAIKALHIANIEVILDVVYNHTAEAGNDGPVLSFKGLVDSEFYLRDEDDYTNRYANYSGCGNSVNADSEFGLKVIMDSLRYWLTDMQVDGFRFDLAASLGRNGERFNRKAALFRAISQDPIVSQAKLIAEPWDIGPEGYQLGNFPADWMECNDRFRDTCRKFWRSELGHTPELASRMLGSRDIFKKNKRSHATSVNYVTYHDGFTLDDLVSYEQRHNLANLEDNKDGHGANFSANNGFEGKTTDLVIIEKRQQQKRNMLATVLLSQGVPHLLAGDEIGRTQCGNNNAYCQDNALSWVDWSRATSEYSLLDFTRYLIKLRAQYPLIQRCFLEDDEFEFSDFHHHVNWIKPNGESKQIDDWHNNENQCLGLVIADDDKKYQLLLLLNASSKPEDYQLADKESGIRLLDTSLPEYLNEQVIITKQYTQNPHSLSLWKLEL